jgi:serpin B
MSLSLSAALPTRALDDASRSNNRFCFAFMAQTDDAKDNAIFSPFSIWSALAMTSAGAEAETLQQMQKVLALPAENSHQTVAGWSDSLKKVTSVKMKVANRLWGNKSLPFRPTFLKLTQQQYGAELEPLDFPGNPEDSRKQINQWVADNTEGKIKDLLSPGLITQATQLVLTNAVYFNGQWALPFSANSTRKEAFTLATGKVVSPDTMNQVMPASYLENDLLQAVKLRYEGGDMAMIIVLPRKNELLGRPAFLTADGFAKVLAEMREEKRVIVQLPRFEATTKLQLAKNLKAMGMPRAFTDEAQFTLMSESPLAISEVVHQAWVKVAEKGTEAAAATAVIAMVGSAMPKEEDPPKRFIADHPFLFFVIDDRNGGIVFAGRLMDPTK